MGIAEKYNKAEQKWFKENGFRKSMDYKGIQKIDIDKVFEEIDKIIDDHCTDEQGSVPLDENGLADIGDDYENGIFDAVSMCVEIIKQNIIQNMR